MRIERADGSVLDVNTPGSPTLEDARWAIALGAVNRVELLEEAGLTPAEARAELEALTRASCPRS